MKVVFHGEGGYPVDRKTSEKTRYQYSEQGCFRKNYPLLVILVRLAVSATQLSSVSVNEQFGVEQSPSTAAALGGRMRCVCGWRPSALQLLSNDSLGICSYFRC